MTDNETNTEKALNRLLSATDFAEKKALIFILQPYLFSAEADSFLEKAAGNYSDNTEISAMLKFHRLLLRYSSKYNIESAFASFNIYIAPDEEVDGILAANQHIPLPKEIDYRILLFQHALKLIGPNRKLSQAQILNNLGYYLRRRSKVTLEDISQAIDYITQALFIYTPQESPDAWVSTNSNLGNAFMERYRNYTGQTIDLEKAMICFNAALEVAYDPIDIGINHLDLGVAWLLCDKDNERLFKSIYHFKSAIDAFIPKEHDIYLIKIHFNLGQIYKELAQKNHNVENFKEAITHYEEVIKSSNKQYDNFLPEIHRELIIEAHHQLGLLFMDYRFGTRSQQAEKAVAHLRQACALAEDADFFLVWAKLTIPLARAYRDCINNRRTNIEQAINLAKSVLDKLPVDFPVHIRAEVHHELGGGYLERIEGNRAENLELSIQHYEQALSLVPKISSQNIRITIENYSKNLASTTEKSRSLFDLMVRHNLAHAYSERLRGDQQENLRIALKYIESVFAHITYEDQPAFWADNHLVASNIYRKLLGFEQNQVLEKAIEHAEAALFHFSPKIHLENWLVLHNTLGLAYRYLLKGDRDSNVVKSIEYYKRALEGADQQILPENWAILHENLGKTYLFRLELRAKDSLRWHEVSEGVEDSICAVHHFQQALQVYTEQTHPYRWAVNQYNIGRALALRPVPAYVMTQVDPAYEKLLSEAIIYFKKALKLLNQEMDVDSTYLVALNLGGANYQLRNYEEAQNAWEVAHSALDIRRSEIARNADKKKISSLAATMYSSLIHCCLINKNIVAAFKYTITGKGRAFIDLVASKRNDLARLSNTYPELRTDLDQITEKRREIDVLSNSINRILEAQQDYNNQEKLDKLYPNLNTKRTEHQELWDRIAKKYPLLTSTQQVPTLDTNQVLQLATSLDANIVEFIAHRGGWGAFVITAEQLVYIDLPEDTNDNLINAAKAALSLQSHTYPSTVDTKWLQVLYDKIFRKIGSHLQLGTRLIMSPMGALHYLPLWAIQNPQTGAYLCDEYQISIVPNIGVLWALLKRFETQKIVSKTERLLSVAYPGDKKDKNYLPNVFLEAQAIAAHFPNSYTALHGADAKAESVFQEAPLHTIIHFGCHAFFDSTLPEDSGLTLSDDILNVRRIIYEMRMQKNRLVTLAACQTGRMSWQKGEEMTGLTQALLVAGAQAVISSLWMVEDESTRSLFEDFYSHLAKGESVASSLQLAMRTVRDQPKWAHPYYWAGFVLNGIGF